MNTKLSCLGMSYQIREKGRKRSMFEKVREIKQKLKRALPEIEDNRLISMLGHCRRYYEGSLYYGRRTTDKTEKKQRKQLDLTQMERVLYDFLLRNNLNPSTTYRWFLATRVPDDIKDKLAKKQISYRKAMQISYNRKRVRESNIGLLMLEEMRIIVRGL
jgi:hypothetical protein